MKRAVGPRVAMKIKLIITVLFFTLFHTLRVCAAPCIDPVDTDPFVVVLDAGHGGDDPGNLGNGYLEKQIALNIVLKVGEILGRNPDVKVIYTRKDDTFVDLHVRGEIANKADADLFVSVHCDSHTSNAQGAGTFVLGLHANKQNFEIAKKENSVIYLEDNYETRYADYDINSPESIIGLTIMQEEFLDQSIALAKLIQDNFSHKLKRTDRKVKQAGFIVLHQTFMPSVLVETGFLTNKEEGAYLNSKKGQAEMGNAIAQAILKYKEGVQPNSAPFGNEVTEKSPSAKEKEGQITNEPNAPAKTGTAVVGASKQNDPAPVEKEVAAKKEDPAPQDQGPGVADKEVRTKETGEKAVSGPAKEIRFRVQLMASSRDLELVPANFKGLDNITKEPFNDLYRYMYGETASFEAAEKLRAKAGLKGYGTAYIVAYKDGKRITVPEALRQVSQ